MAVRPIKQFNGPFNELLPDCCEELQNRPLCGEKTRISRLLAGFRDHPDGLVMVSRRVDLPRPRWPHPTRRSGGADLHVLACWRVWAASGRLRARVALEQLSPGNQLDLAADGDVYPVAFPLGPQVQERWALDLVPLLDPHVYGVRAEEAVFDEVSGQAAGGAAGGGIFGYAQVVGEHACRDVAGPVPVRLWAERVEVLARGGRLAVEVPMYAAASQGVEAPHREDDGWESGRDFVGRAAGAGA